MGHLDKARVVDPILTNIARGYHNSAFIGEQIFPTVDVEKEAGKIPQFGKESFMSYKTERAIRADSNQMDGDFLSTIKYSTEEHDIERRIDYREEKESFMNEKVLATRRTKDVLSLGHELKAAELLQDADNYADSNKETLVDNQLDDSGIDPTILIREKRNALRDIIGARANTLVMGPAVYDVLVNHPLIIEKIKYSQTGIVTKDLLKRLLEVNEILVGEAIYSEDKKTFKDIWGNNLVLFYKVPNSGMAKTPYQPSFGYTLRKKGHPFVDTYNTNGGKIKVIRCTTNYDIKIVGAESAYLLKDVIARS